MRITPYEVESIVRTVHRFVPSASVRLFGSRTDDAKRGGDIDLLILADAPVASDVRDKIELRLHDLIGEQKIDILIEQVGNESTFGKLALSRSIPLEASQ